MSITISPDAADFLDLMPHVVTIEPYLGTTGNNKASYDTLRYYRAYISGTGELFRNTQGQQVVSSASIYVYPLEVNTDGTPKTGAMPLLSLPEQSRVTWPDAGVSGGVARPVTLKVNRIDDELGVLAWQIHT